VYVDPNDVNDITKKLKYMVNATEKDRQQFSKKIEDHLSQLSWRKSAEITASALTGLSVSYFANKE